jgi:hypothetical protein
MLSSLLPPRSLPRPLPPTTTGLMAMTAAMLLSLRLWLLVQVLLLLPVLLLLHRLVTSLPLL